MALLEVIVDKLKLRLIMLERTASSDIHLSLFKFLHFVDDPPNVLLGCLPIAFFTFK
jgi:hypothetical protein